MESQACMFASGQDVNAASKQNPLKLRTMSHLVGTQSFLIIFLMSGACMCSHVHYDVLHNNLPRS